MSITSDETGPPTRVYTIRERYTLKYYIRRTRAKYGPMNHYTRDTRSDSRHRTRIYTYAYVMYVRRCVRAKYDSFYCVVRPRTRDNVTIARERLHTHERACVIYLRISDDRGDNDGRRRRTVFPRCA